MAASALNNASDNSVLSDPASDKVAADGTGKYKYFVTDLLAHTFQAWYSWTHGFLPSRMPSGADTVMPRSG